MKTNYSVNGKLLLFCFLLFSVSFYSQDKKKADSVIALLLDYQQNDPDKAIQLSKSLLDTAKSTKPSLYMAIGMAYWSKGDKDKTMEYLELSKNTAEINEDPAEYTKTLITIAEFFVKMRLNDKAKVYLYSAREKTEEIKDIRSKILRRNWIDFQFAEICEYEKNYRCAIDLFNKVNLSFQKIKVGKDEIRIKNSINQNLATSYIHLANIYIELKDFDKAEQYFKLSYTYSKSITDDVNQSLALCYLGSVYRLKGNNDKALSTVLPLLETNAVKQSKALQQEVHKELSEIYKSKKNIEKENYHNNKYIELLGKDASIEKKAINKSVTNIDKENKSNFNLFQRKTYYIVAIIILIAVFIYTYQRIKISKAKKRYNEILKKLEESKSAQTMAKQSNKPVINVDKGQEILDKLRKFEVSKEFLNKNLTLSSLSTKLKTNNTYLSEIINRHYNKNFNTYINELKIYYIIEKIKEENKYKNYKISYLADECGFVSHSAFTTTFKNVTGITPSEFINLSKTQNSDKIMLDNV